jgi:hypothetical protein
VNPEANPEANPVASRDDALRYCFSMDSKTLAALSQAADELGLPAHYISCVRPLLNDIEGPWPRCCGGGCEPCAQTLTDVAVRTLELLGKKRQSPLP